MKILHPSCLAVAAYFTSGALAQAQPAAAPAPAPAAAPTPAAAPAAPAAPTPGGEASTPVQGAPPNGSADPAAPKDAQPVEVWSAANAVPPDATSADSAASTNVNASAQGSAADAPLNLAEFTQDASSGVGSDEGKINFYGFSDFTFSQPLSRGLGGIPYPSFYVGNLNLYMASDLGADFRSLAEVRFTYLPHGNQAYDANFNLLPRTDTTAADYTDLGRPLKWGGVSIQRAWVEKTFHPLFTARVGHWLTPYGIWNVDHGSPVIIGVRRPYIVGDQFFPSSQTGIELYGSTAFGPTQVGYHLTLSNGRGPVDTYQDWDTNKAVGARVWGKYDSEFGTFTLGTSMYRGRFTDRRTTPMVSADGAFETRYYPTLQYEELSLAADFKWEHKGALFQAEGILHDVSYQGKEKLRPVVTSAFGGPNGYQPDTRRSGVYGLLGYRTDFLGTMPFFGGEYYYIGNHSLVPDAFALWTGLNVRPTPRVVVKGVYTESWFIGQPTFGVKPVAFQSLDFQVAWSF